MASITHQERLQQLKAFDESKAGVKGLVDKGVTKVPPIFMCKPEDPSANNIPNSGKPIGPDRFTIPIVDLGDIVAGRPDKVIQDIRLAAENVGFFYVVNHGIPQRVLQEMLDATRGFHELPREVKAEYYNRDPKRRVKYFSTYDLYVSKFATWRDSLFIQMKTPEPLDPQELPPVCRDTYLEYSEQVHKVGCTLLNLLSQALGLESNHLVDMGCAKEHLIISHYYPPCPEPELTIGTGKHSDGTYITLLLQDHIGGLQIWHQNQWNDVRPIPGALIVNIGNLMQIISNDKFISENHRVLSKKEGPRISVGFFFQHTSTKDASKVYEPIKELTSKENPPVYRSIALKDYDVEFYKNSLTEVPTLDYLKV